MDLVNKKNLSLFEFGQDSGKLALVFERWTRTCLY